MLHEQGSRLERRRFRALASYSTLVDTPVLQPWGNVRATARGDLDYWETDYFAWK